MAEFTWNAACAQAPRLTMRETARRRTKTCFMEVAALTAYVIDQNKILAIRPPLSPGKWRRRCLHA